MAINRDFLGLRAFSADFARDKIEEREIPHPMVKSAAHFGAPKPSYGHFSYPASLSRGKFSSRKTPKMAINRDFPGLRAFSANFARDNTNAALNALRNDNPLLKSSCTHEVVDSCGV